MTDTNTAAWTGGVNSLGFAKAPADKEVEELSKKEIFKCLRERASVEQCKTEPKTKELKEFIKP